MGEEKKRARNTAIMAGLAILEVASILLVQKLDIKESIIIPLINLDLSIVQKEVQEFLQGKMEIVLGALGAASVYLLAKTKYHHDKQKKAEAELGDLNSANLPLWYDFRRTV